MIDFCDPTELESSLQKAVEYHPEHLKVIKKHFEKIHPFQDGRSSERVADAAINMIEKGTKHLERKPRNYIRSMKIYRELKKSQAKIS